MWKNILLKAHFLITSSIKLNAFAMLQFNLALPYKIEKFLINYILEIIF